MGLFGGIESGGTKFVCMIGSDPDHIVSEIRIPTTTPDETIRKTVEFFTPYSAGGELSAIGIASFGPLDLNPESKTYGHITTTPKLVWQNTDLYGWIHRELNVPVAFDTDVNAAAFGELFWNHEIKLADPIVYMTVGTGIGVGLIVHGKPLHGLIHPEGGHFAMPHDWQRDPFPGVCPYHGDCLEGLASGPSMKERWNQDPESIPDSHPAWDLEAEYVSQAALDLIYAYSPQKIVLGGGVLQHSGLIDKIRTMILQKNKGYVQSDLLLNHIEKYVHLPTLGNRSGVLGAMAMAIKKFDEYRL